MNSLPLCVNPRNWAAMNELQRLRLEQVRCADHAIRLSQKLANDKTGSPDEAAKTDAEREFAMLGVSDYLIEEMLLTFWLDQIHAAIEKQEKGEHPS
jgi:hypothetical protein